MGADTHRTTSWQTGIPNCRHESDGAFRSRHRGIRDSLRRLGNQVEDRPLGLSNYPLSEESVSTNCPRDRIQLQNPHVYQVVSREIQLMIIRRSFEYSQKMHSAIAKYLYKLSFRGRVRSLPLAFNKLFAERKHADAREVHRQCITRGWEFLCRVLGQPASSPCRFFSIRSAGAPREICP